MKYLFNKDDIENLTSLDLSYNGLKELPKEIAELKNLTDLNLSNNELKELPKEIAELKNLTNLNLSNNELKELPKEIVELKNLTSLDLSYNGLKELPKEIAELKNLTNLNLLSNGLKEFPKEIVELKNLTNLDLSYNGLKELPKEIAELKNLTYLNLSSNGLKELPKEIAELKNLTYLNLSGNELKELPKEIAELKNLTNLNLLSNGLKELPKEIAELKNLTNLNLSGNGLKELPKEIVELKNLTYLDLLSNGLKELPKEIAELKNLTYLNLLYNELKELPKEIVELKNLTNLNLSSNELKELPKEIAELKNLTSLDLSGNELKELPKEIAELKNLTNLDLSSNGLKELPKEIAELKNLTSLDLSSNGLKELPKEIVELKNLTSLDLSSNGLKELPKEIAELKNLTYLDLSGNELKELPKEIAELKNLTYLDLSYNGLKEIAELKNLTYLDLSGNGLKELPKEIAELKNLTYLNLSSNGLKELQKEIAELKNLTYLNLSSNELKELPKEIAELKNLTNLDLSSNGLKELPKEIAELKNLTNLDLSSNGLKELPKEIAELKNLTYLNLSNNGLKKLPSSFFDKKISLELKYDIRRKGILISGNPLVCPPIEIIEKGEKSLSLYFDALKEGSEKLREVKVIFIGEGSAGKTSIINRITEKKFNNNEPKTHGIRINEKLHKDKKIYFWDFGGQDIMHSTHQFFLSKRCIYVLVLDGRKDEKPKYWLDMIKSFGQNSPIFVVLNKKENDNSFDISKKTLKNDYSSIIDFFELNCSEDNNGGTKEFNEKLLDFIDNSNNEELSLGTPIPKKWLNLKNNLVALTDNHQRYKSFEKLCAKEGIEDTHIPIIVSLLHELGIMLHFEGDLLLESYYILNPKWVLDAAYKIINSSKVKSNKGKFVEKDVLEILNYEGFEEYKLYPELNNYKYDKEETKFIFLLFKEFKLGYEIEKSMFLPDLLSNEYDDYQPLEDYIHIVYEYIFMPPSIMPQIIVALHKDIKDNIVWRQGVLLESNFFRCKAEIISDKERKNLNIKVSGLDKKEYLAYIRKIISDIHLPSFKSIEEPQLYLKIESKQGNPKPISFKYLKQLEASGQKSFRPESTNDILCDEYLISELLGSVRSKEEIEELIINKVIDELKSLNEKISQHDIEDKILNFKASFGVGEINLGALYKKINEKLMLFHTKFLLKE